MNTIADTRNRLNRHINDLNLPILTRKIYDEMRSICYLTRYRNLAPGPAFDMLTNDSRADFFAARSFNQRVNEWQALTFENMPTIDQAIKDIWTKIYKEVEICRTEQWFDTQEALNSRARGMHHFNKLNELFETNKALKEFSDTDLVIYPSSNNSLALNSISISDFDSLRNLYLEFINRVVFTSKNPDFDQQFPLEKP